MDNQEWEQFVEDNGWLFGGAALVLYVAVAVIFFIAYVRIIQKAGYSGWCYVVGLSHRHECRARIIVTG